MENNIKKGRVFKSKRSKILFGIVVVLMVMGIGLKLFENRKPAAPKYTLHTVEKQEPLIFDGQVKAEDTQEVFQNPSYGEVSSVLVKEGETISEGQGLIRFKNNETNNQLKDAYRAKEKAIESYNYAYEDYNNALSKYNKTYRKEKNAKDSMEKGELKLMLEQENEGVKTQKRALREADTAVEDANRTISNLEETVTHTQTSYIKGVVHINERAMNNPSSQEALLSVISANVIVVGSLTEFDFNAVKAQDKVTLSPINGDPEVSGTVIEKSDSPSQSVSLASSQPQGGSSSGTESSSYEFRVQPDKPLQNGYSVSIKKHQEGLIIPEETVLEEEGKHFIFLYEEGKVKKHEVSVVKKADGYFANGGITEGMQIFSIRDDLVDGMEVREDETQTHTAEETE